MKRIKGLICIFLSVSMIFSMTAYAFGETIDEAERGDLPGDTAKVLNAQAADGGNRFPPGENALLFPKIKINRKDIKIGRGEKLRLKAFYYPPTQREKNFRWSSTDRKVAKVTSEGIVKGIRTGRASIVVSLRSNPGVRAACKVIVGYTIKYNVNGGRLARKSPRVYYNEKVTLKEPFKKGYEFKGWYTDRNHTKKITSIDKDADRDYKLYAKWEKV